MTSEASLVATANIVAGVLIVVLAAPLILGRVRMNAWYGVRLRKAYASEANWYALNRAGGTWLAIAGVVIVLLGAVVFLAQPRSTPLAILLAIAPAPIVLLTLIPILRLARRLPS